MLTTRFIRLCTSLCHSLPKPTRTVKIRTRALLQAQEALTDYLHLTRCFQFSHAEQISKHCPFFLSNLISKLTFSDSNLSKNLKKYLSYHPINEFEAFFESIGFSPQEFHVFLPTKQFFLSESSDLLTCVRVLIEFGFPWNKLGLIYKEESSLFSSCSNGLKERLIRLEELGFDKVNVIGICLNFPFVLGGVELGSSRVENLLGFLKCIFVECSSVDHSSWSVEICYHICRNIKLFYDMGCGEEMLKEAMRTNPSIFLEFSGDVLAGKVDFFRRLGSREEDIGAIILRCPEILNFDLENGVIVIPDFLKHVGLDEGELEIIGRKYPHVFGRNRLRNLPQLMKAMNLQDWFFSKIMGGDHHLLVTSSYKELEKNVEDYTEMILGRKKHHLMHKLEFFLGIGFGENKRTFAILRLAHGTNSKLQDRFDFLLRTGITFSELCKMIRVAPKILNQSTYMIEQKVKFLLNDLHCPLQDLVEFPAYLMFDLEKRIKPRYRFISWLRENDLLKREFSISTVLSNSEKKFIPFLRTIHPAAPKLWLESFAFKGPESRS